MWLVYPFYSFDSTLSSLWLGLLEFSSCTIQTVHITLNYSRPRFLPSLPPWNGRFSPNSSHPVDLSTLSDPGLFIYISPVGIPDSTTSSLLKKTFQFLETCLALLLRKAPTLHYGTFQLRQLDLILTVQHSAQPRLRIASTINNLVHNSAFERRANTDDNLLAKYSTDLIIATKHFGHLRDDTITQFRHLQIYRFWSLNQAHKSYRDYVNITTQTVAIPGVVAIFCGQKLIVERKLQSTN